MRFVPIAADDFAATLDFLELSAGAFAYIVGEPVESVEAWLSGAAAVPHWVSLVTLLFSHDRDGIRLGREHSTALKEGGPLIEDILAESLPGRAIRAG